MPGSDQYPPEAYGPPAVVLDEEGATVWLGGEAYSSILWSQLASVEIGIVTNPGLSYSEAFWRLAGGGAEVFAPVELIVNSARLNDRLFKLPGFDVEMYRRAREAESQGLSGEFVCWRRNNS